MYVCMYVCRVLKNKKLGVAIIALCVLKIFCDALLENSIK
jgi:hypothetical protein